MFKWRNSIRFGMKNTRTPSFCCKIMFRMPKLPLSHTLFFTVSVSKLPTALHKSSNTSKFSYLPALGPFSLPVLIHVVHKTNSLCSVTAQALVSFQNQEHTLFTTADCGWGQQCNKQHKILQQAVECITVLPWYSGQSSPLKWNELLSLKPVWL